MTSIRPRRTLTALAVSLLCLILGPAPALAASAYQPCPPGAYCMWLGAYRAGKVAFWRASTIGNGVRIKPWFAGKASAEWNRGSFTVRAYATPDCVGSPLLYHDFGPGSYVPNLATIGMDNVIRSLQNPDRYTGRC